MVKTAVIIVTHNSGQVIERCLSALAEQSTRIDSLVIVDSGSSVGFSLELSASVLPMKIFHESNIGFSQANNIGFHYLDKGTDYILFLNPDAFLQSDFLEKAIEVMEQSPYIGILTGRMSGFDIQRNTATNLLDSTGVFRKWYGKWFDRGQGEPDKDNYTKVEEIPAVCGALMFCRRIALVQAALPSGALFDPDFFLYKEDIELSLRIRKTGWKLLYHPELSVYHCRGWHRDRQKTAIGLRRMAAGNEVLLYRKHPSPYILWAFFKYFLVRFFHV